MSSCFKYTTKITGNHTKVYVEHFLIRLVLLFLMWQAQIINVMITNFILKIKFTHQWKSLFTETLSSVWCKLVKICFILKIVKHKQPTHLCDTVYSILCDVCCLRPHCTGSTVKFTFNKYTILLVFITAITGMVCINCWKRHFMFSALSFLISFFKIIFRNQIKASRLYLFVQTMWLNINVLSQ